MSNRTTAVSCGVAAGVAALGVAVAAACTTPVFRYAMYNWAPAPYEVFYFHRGPIRDDDAEVNRKLSDLASALEGGANVGLRTVDVAQPKQLEQLPEVVLQTWKTKHAEAVPSYAVWGPWGAEVFAGRLDAAAVDEMIDSPARRRVGELLKEGNAAVLVLVPGEKDPDNQKAETAIREVLARAASGQIPVSGAPEEPLALADEDPGRSADVEPRTAGGPKGLKLATLKVSRSDPKERWLVRMLMALEPDLHEFAAEPMVFAVYGRGRAMEPFVAKGITADNLTELALFLAGPCSCQVKDSNPGKDLLFHWDWRATAEALAAAEEAADERQPMYAEVAPGEGDRPAAASGEPGSAGQKQAPAATPAKLDPPALTTSEPASGAQPAEAKPTQLVPHQEAPRAEVTAVASIRRQMWQFGVGFAVVTVIVLAAGFVLARRQSGGSD